MANEIPGLSITLKSSGDMSSYQFAPVVASTANAAGGCTVVLTEGAKVTGIWQGDSTSAEFGRVMVSGVSKAQARAVDTAIVSGSLVYASTDGLTTGSTDAAVNYVGQSLDALSTGSTGFIRVLLTIGSISAATT